MDFSVIKRTRMCIWNANSDPNGTNCILGVVTNEPVAKMNNQTRNFAKFHQYVDMLRPVDDEWQTRKLRYLFARFTMLAHDAIQIGFPDSFVNEELRIVFKCLLPYQIQVEVTSTTQYDDDVDENMDNFLDAFEQSLRKREVIECETTMNLAIRNMYGYSELFTVACCVFCDSEDHSNSRCTAPYAERLRVIKEKKLCFGCLKPGHRRRDCIKDIRCRLCGRNHYSYMCRQNFGTPEVIQMNW